MDHIMEVPDPVGARELNDQHAPRDMRVPVCGCLVQPTAEPYRGARAVSPAALRRAAARLRAAWKASLSDP